MKQRETKILKISLVRNPTCATRIRSQAKQPLKDVAAVNATRWKLFETLIATGLPITTGSGALTKYNRCRLDLPKEHWIDACDSFLLGA